MRDPATPIGNNPFQVVRKPQRTDPEPGGEEQGKLVNPGENIYCPGEKDWSDPKQTRVFRADGLPLSDCHDSTLSNWTPGDTGPLVASLLQVSIDMVAC